MFWNPNAQAATGRSAASVVGQPLAAIFPEHEGGPDRTRFDMTDVMDGRDYSGGFRTRRADGSPVTLHVYATAGHPSGKERGHVAGVVFVARDVTNAVEVEQAARVKEEQFRAVLALTADAVILLDERGKVLQANRAMAELVGREENELLGLTVLDLVVPGGRDVVAVEFARLWRSGEAEFAAELVGRPGGASRLEFRATVLNLYGQRVALAVGRRQTAEENRARADETERRYQRIFVAVRDAVLLHRADGSILDVNEGAIRIFGVSKKKLVGLDIEKLIPPASRTWLARLQRMILSDGEFYGEGMGLRRDGTEFPIELSSSLVELDSEKVVITVVRDISERRRAEAAVRASEHLHRTTMAAMSDPAHVIDRDYRIVLVNEALLSWSRSLGAGDDLVGRVVFDAYSFLGAKVRGEYEEVFATGRPLRTEETTILRGRRIETETQKLPVVEGGVVSRVLTVMRDVTDQKRHEETLERLADTATGFVELTADADLYLHAAERLAELLPGTLFAVGEYDEPAARLTVRRVVGLTEEEMTAIGAALGAAPEGMVLAGVPPEVHEVLMAGTVREVPGGLYDALLRRVPEPACRELERRLGIEKAVSIGLRRENRLYGNVTFYLRAGEKLDRGLVETFVGQWAIALERQEAELALAESEERMASAFNYAAIGMAFVAPDGRLLKVNRAFARMLGYTEEELLSRTFQDVTHPDDLEADLEHVRRMLAGEIATYQMEKRYFHKTTRVIWALLSASLVRDREGRPLHFISQVQDVTERHRAETELQRQTEFQELLTKTAATYIDLPPAEINEAIGKSLAELGGFVGADRAYLFSYDFARGVSTNTHEWCREGIEPQMHRLQEFPLDHARGELEMHTRGLPHHVPSVEALPQDNGLRAELEAEGVKSLITVPLMDGGNCLGFVGFDSVRARREYTKAEQGLLTVFAQMLVDVRRHSEMEAVLRSSEERYSSLFAGAPIGIYRSTPDGRVLMANPALVRMLGYASIEEMSQIELERDAGFQPGYHRAEFKRRVEHEGEIIGLESTWTRADGGRLYIRENARAVRGPDGSIAYYEGTVEDLTERHQAEERERAERERAETYLDIAGVIIIALDEQGLVSLVNRRGCELLGTSEDDALGSDWVERFVPAADREKTRATFAALMRGELELTEEFENRITSASGEERLVHWHNVLLRDPEGRVIGTLSSGEDITARRAAEEALQESEQTLRDLRDNTPVGLFRTSTDGRFLSLNPAAVRMMGYDTEAEMKKLPTTGFYADLDKRRAMLGKLVSEGAVSGYEIDLRRRDGEVFPAMFDIRTVPGPDGQPEYFDGVIQDVSVRRTAEEALRGRQALLETLAKMSLELLHAGPEQADSVVEAELGKMAFRARADRGYVFLLSEDGRTMNNTHEWCAAGIEPQKRVLQGLPVEDFPWWVAKLTRGEHIYVPRVADLPLEAAAEKEILEAQNIVSVLVLPVAERGRLQGYIGLDWVRGPIDMAEGLLPLLQVSADLLFGTLNRARAEAAHRASEEHLQAMLNTSPDGIAVHQEGRVVLMNPAGARMLGYDDPAEVIGKSVLDFLYPDERDEVLSRMKRIVETGPTGVPAQARFRRRDGSYVPLDVANALLDWQGRPAVQVVFRDITARLKAQQGLEASEERYRNLVELALDGICIIREGRIAYLNPQLAALAGVKVEECLGRPFTDFVHPSERERLADRYRRRMAGEAVPEHYETVVVHADGHEVRVEIKAGVIMHEGAPADLVFVRDISGRHRAGTG